MNVELRKVRTNKALSEETACFSAELWIDGRKAAAVGNRGHGGPHEYHFTDRATQAAFSDWAKSQPHEFDFEIDDQAIDGLLAAIEKDKAIAKIRRKCLSGTLFLRPGDGPGEYREIARPIAQIRDSVIARIPGAIFLNDLDDAGIASALFGGAA